MTAVDVPADPPDRCPACGDIYESVSRHAGGFVVALRENDRYARVCFHPVGVDGNENSDDDVDRDEDSDDDGDAHLDCYHHTHADVGDTPE
ncbi:hypothetical protein JCM18237_02440 [Halorubrum luteum]